MAIKKSKPTSAGRRFRTDLAGGILSKTKPEKSLTRGKTGSVGRSHGRVSVRHRSAGSKKLFRAIDFKRDKVTIVAKVFSIEYDPNRTCNIALLNYADGEKRYILAPDGLKVGDEVVSSDKAPLTVGNAMKLSQVATGTMVHNIELHPGRGGQFARSAGSYATVVAKEGKYVQLKMPSGERRLILSECRATIGQLGNTDWKKY
jgi:large subunit ribosomal protein L2